MCWAGRDDGVLELDDLAFYRRCWLRHDLGGSGKRADAQRNSEESWAATGGVHDYNGMGSVLLPWGMSAEQFDKQVDQAWKTQVTDAGIKAPPGQYGLQSYGDSQYLVKLGTGYLLKDDGTPVVIDLTQQRQRFSGGIPQ